MRLDIHPKEDYWPCFLSQKKYPIICSKFNTTTQASWPYFENLNGSSEVIIVRINAIEHLKKKIQIDTTNPITSLDFDPQGKYIATADSSGGCLVSAVETNEPTVLLKESLDFFSAASIQPMSVDSRV